MEAVLTAMIGVGLAAACGFRVFVPLLVASVSVQVGWVTPTPDFAWLGTWPAIAALTVATTLELTAYYVPWLDNLLDTAATPAATIAGTLITAGFVAEADPVLRWSAAVIAGGGAATGVQLTTVAARAASTTMTAGLGNWAVATLEAVGAVLTAVLALVVPALTLVAVTVLVIGVGRRALRSRAAPADA